MLSREMQLPVVLTSGARMFANHLRSQLGSLVFPACCPFCKQQIIPSEFDRPANQYVDGCVTCCQRLIGHPLDRCTMCGANTHPDNPFAERCRLCHGLDLRFESCVAIGDYQGLLQEIVVQMKRAHDEILAIQLGRMLRGQMDRCDIGTDCDLVVPVPTHWLRRFKRGFHAASVIADGIVGGFAGRSVQGDSLRKSDDIIFCSKSTRKQGTLMNAGRFANVRGAFHVKSRAKIADKKLLVVDDVMTSGATASEVAKTLLQAGASGVVIAVAARGARVS